MCKETSLLDAMAIQMGCDYLSDLRFLDSSQQAVLAEKLKNLPSSMSDLHDWNDALQYLIGQPPQSDAEQAKAALIVGLSAH